MTDAPRLSIAEQLSRVLDKGYTAAVTPILRAIVRNLTTGIVVTRLAQVDDEANRSVLAADSPAFRALVVDLTLVMRRNAALVDAGGAEAQTVGLQAAAKLTRQLALPGVLDAALKQTGLAWHTPPADVLARIVQYTTSDAWRNELGAYAKMADRIQGIALRRMVEGRHPLAIAREVRQAVEGLPVHQANQMMRSLQLTAYRDATAAHQAANAHILDHAVRVEALDGRTCLACWSLHGEKLPLGGRPDEHRNGRAVAVGVVKGSDRSVVPGEARFAALPEAQQRDIMGHANYEAYRAGRVRLEDFAHRHDDPVFGGAVREASLKGILGEGAKEYYAN